MGVIQHDARARLARLARSPTSAAVGHPPCQVQASTAAEASGSLPAPTGPVEGAAQSFYAAEKSAEAAPDEARGTSCTTGLALKDGFGTEEAAADHHACADQGQGGSEPVVTNGADGVPGEAVRGRSGQPDEEPLPEKTEEEGARGDIEDVPREKGIAEGGPLASSFFRSQARQGASHWRPAPRGTRAGQDEERQEGPPRAVQEASAGRADEQDDGAGQRAGESGMRTARELLRSGQGRKVRSQQGPKQAALDLRKDDDNGYTGHGLGGPSGTMGPTAVGTTKSCTLHAETGAKLSLGPAYPAPAEGSDERAATWQDKEVDTRWSPERPATEGSGGGAAAPGVKAGGGGRPVGEELVIAVVTRGTPPRGALLVDEAALGGGLSPMSVRRRAATWAPGQAGLKACLDAGTPQAGS